MLQRMTYPFRQRQLLLIQSNNITTSDSEIKHLLTHNVAIHPHHHPIIHIEGAKKNIKMTVLCKDKRILFMGFI